MRNYEKELENRIKFIRDCLEDANAGGIVYGNSGGKDSALVGILCKMACDNTVGIIMPAGVLRSYNLDKDDALSVASKFHIETRTVDLKSVKDSLINAVSSATNITPAAHSNIAPRLRMATLYMIAASENRLVAGTGNKSECYMGYFTKWGDGAFDFNPIGDLTVTEIYEFLRFLKAPQSIIEKSPSAGLFDGQTDENEMGVTYKSIDLHLCGQTVSPKEKAVIEKYHKISEHKRCMPAVYGVKNEY